MSATSSSSASRCKVCRAKLTQPQTGRRRTTCSDRCRSQLRRNRAWERRYGDVAA